MLYRLCHTVAVWGFHYFILSCIPSNKDHFRCNKQSLMQPELWFSVCKSYKDTLCWKGNVVRGIFQLMFLLCSLCLINEYCFFMLLLYYSFSLLLHIINYSVYFCIISDMLWFCFFIGTYIFMKVGRERKNAVG